MNKSESRYFRTAEKMGAALMALMEKKDFEYITVQEICQAADVHRSTFYLHYQNTCELLEEATARMLEEFRAQFADIAAPEGECFITPAYVMPFLAYIRSHRRLWRTVLRQPGQFGTEKLYQTMLRRLFGPILARYHYPENHRDYVIRFYLNGVNALIACWLEKDCAESDEEIYRIIRDCIFGKTEE